MLDVPVYVTQSTSIAEWMTAIGTLAAAVATFLAVLVALFGRDLWDRRHRPILEIAYEPKEPYCRYTQLASGVAARWVRVKVTNRGRGSARECRGKMIAAYGSDGSPRGDRDPLLLRWAAIPKDQQMQPLDLAPKEGQFLNVVVATSDNQNEATIATEPGGRFGFSPTLEAGQTHLVRLGVYADNAEPMTAEFVITYGGGLDSLKMERA